MSTKARTLKIEAIGDFAKGKIKPRIRLNGHWLEKAGFKPGHRAEIHLTGPGEMMLRLMSDVTVPNNYPPKHVATTEAQ
jgi:hypothetical protein